MKHLDHQHPVRVILYQAALGNEPTREFLDRLLVRDDLPEGHDLNRHRRRITEAAAKVYETANPAPGAHAHGPARQLADELCGDLADHLSIHEAAITNTEANPESLADIGARMFGRN